MTTAQKSARTEPVERLEALGDELQRRAFRSAALQRGGKYLTFQQYLALEHLEAKGSCSVKDLKLTLGIAPSTASELVTRMDRGGLISKERDPVDARAMRVTLTAKGREALEKRRSSSRSLYGELLSGRPVKEQQELLSALEVVLARLPGASRGEEDEQE